MADDSYANKAVAALTAIREKNPLTHCMTNMVSMDFMANVLLAGGCSPAMVHAAEEVQQFVEIPGGLLINIGTLDERWVHSFEQAAFRASELGKAWVLDPVGVGATTFRADTVKKLMKYHPTVIRGNASEILAIASKEAHGSKGVDSTAGSNNAVACAKLYATKHNCVVAVSGEHDYITDGKEVLRVGNGVPLLQQITASGCSVTALVAAYIFAKPESVSVVEATAAAMAVFGLAAERAAATAKGPGSLRSGLLDELWTMSSDDVLKGVKISKVE